MGKLAEENESIISFAVSPNQQILVTTTKNYAIKAYRMGELPEEVEEGEATTATWKPEKF